MIYSPWIHFASSCSFILAAVSNRNPCQAVFCMVFISFDKLNRLHSNLLHTPVSFPSLWFWFPTALGLFVPFWSWVASVSFQRVCLLIPVTSFIQSPWISSFSTHTPCSQYSSALGFFSLASLSPCPSPTLFVPSSVQSLLSQLALIASLCTESCQDFLKMDSSCVFPVFYFQKWMGWV